MTLRTPIMPSSVATTVGLADATARMPAVPVRVGGWVGGGEQWQWLRLGVSAGERQPGAGRALHAGVHACTRSHPHAHAPGGRMASNVLTPYMPMLEMVKLAPVYSLGACGAVGGMGLHGVAGGVGEAMHVGAGGVWRAPSFISGKR